MKLIVVYKSNDAQSLLSALIVKGYNQDATISYIDTFGKTSGEIDSAITALDGSQDYCYNAVTVGATADITSTQETNVKAKLTSSANYSNWTSTDRSTTVDRALQAWNEITSNKYPSFILFEMADLVGSTTTAQRLEGAYVEAAIEGKYNSTETDDDLSNLTTDSLYPIIDKGLLDNGINSVLESGFTNPIIDNAALSIIIEEGKAAYDHATEWNVDVVFTVVDGSAAAIEAATITLDGQSGTTDASGEATIENVSVGTDLYYTVTKTGYVTKTGTVDVANGLDVAVAVTLISASTVTVTVVDASDGTTPLENAVVVAGDASGQVTGTTVALGTVDLVLGYDDDVPVSAALTDYTSNAGVLTVDGATETLTIQLTHV